MTVARERWAAHTRMRDAVRGRRSDSCGIRPQFSIYACVVERAVSRGHLKAAPCSRGAHQCMYLPRSFVLFVNSFSESSNGNGVSCYTEMDSFY